MTSMDDAAQLPIPISQIAGRFYVFSIDAATYLRREHNICGVLIGTLPQIPQQNVFLGMPLELLPEEARVLVEAGICYLVNDADWHRKSMRQMSRPQRDTYLNVLRTKGAEARRAAEEETALRAERGRAKQRAKARKGQNEGDTKTAKAADPAPSADEASTSVVANDTIFDAAPLRKVELATSTPYALTPTISPDPLYAPQGLPAMPLPSVPISYPLFSHLHSRKYFITPGIRFGCDYSVYPGDPLRFHSHFLAVGYEWDQEIPLLDIIGGGRLGTGVKKGFLIGGESQDAVRTFCIEWGGM